MVLAPYFLDEETMHKESQSLAQSHPAQKHYILDTRPGCLGLDCHSRKGTNNIKQHYFSNLLFTFHQDSLLICTEEH